MVDDNADMKANRGRIGFWLGFATAMLVGSAWAVVLGA